MDSSRLISSAVPPFRAPGGSGGQVLLFGGGGFHGDATMATGGVENGRWRKRPFLTALEDFQLELGLDVEYELQSTAERTTKRRLTAEQVRALEVSFEEEKRKLEPERKSELARRLGISPRQVAVWFQNRRARWRAKQLEQDFDRLRAAHDELLAGRDALAADNDRLRSQVITLTEKLQIKVQNAASAIIDSADMKAVGLFVQIDQDQLCQTTGSVVPAQGFAAREANSDSLESYFVSVPSTPQSSEGDCGDEGNALLLPDPMLPTSVKHGHADDDNWEWFWN